ncbi:MAG TPA: nucleotidyltransferase domain-containing protein [Anaerolineae bacterium]|nr:nucleotidyltransferase domain-containing protein [Anaerolineae bacterium]
MKRETVEGLKQELTKRYIEALSSNLVALAFFGSWARGEEKEWSDVDVLLVAEELPDDPFERRWLVQEPVLGLSERSISVLARTVEEFSEDVSPLHLDLGLDAIVFHDPRGFLAQRLKRVRELIEEAGLVREREASGFAWRWKHAPPPGRWALTWEGFTG